MHKLLLFFCLLHPFISVAQDDWMTFDSEIGNFSILVPDSMTQTTKDLDLAIGKLKYQIYHYQGPDTSENWLYQVSYVDYPAGTVHSDSIEFLEMLFDENVKSSTKSVYGKLAYQTDDNYQNYPGQIFKVHFADNQAAIKTRLYMVENRFYTISVTGPRGLSLNPKVEQFLNSFNLLEIPEREGKKKKRRKS